ncbi:hypothetical protein E3N88_14191 [Mikania micrantha]|uniref:DNA-directed RNA polymerase RBP11-like dimerisation domain-containing protein n=1 Tax=Mikania micrantha TaxID=192012 RepID=A0A5N6P2F7_9ASTR|nr:hypothetical protein E3N88_14191 [Mikania micrantha]
MKEIMKMLNESLMLKIFWKEDEKQRIKDEDNKSVRSLPAGTQDNDQERTMNAPDRYERFVVPEGTKKVSYERDTKIINAASFTIEREDHTIGNIVRMQLHRDGNVLFAGYKLPHPLQYKIIVRVVDMACTQFVKTELEGHGFPKV